MTQPHVFDWCSSHRSDQHHTRCHVAYLRQDGTPRVCECPRHTQQQVQARLSQLAARAQRPSEPTPPARASRRAQRDVQLRTFECEGRTVQASSPTKAAELLGVSRRKFREHGRELVRPAVDGVGTPA